MKMPMNTHAGKTEARVVFLRERKIGGKNTIAAQDKK